MTHKWLKRIAWILAIPFFLFIILILLLYIPPVQNLLLKEVTAYASQATGMQINIERIDLRFPANLLLRGVEVIQDSDTLLTFESLNASVQLMPLFQKKVELNDLTLKQASVNSLNLIDGMLIKGDIGELGLTSREIDLTNQTILINSLRLDNTALYLNLNDTTTAPKDSASAPVNWDIKAEDIKIKDLVFAMQMPADTIYLDTYLNEVQIQDVTAVLAQQLYGVKKLEIENSSVKYTSSLSLPAQGLDPSHIELSDIKVAIDSVMYKGKEIKATIRELAMKERSGLEIISAQGKLSSDSIAVSLPEFTLNTPYSNIDLNAFFPWDLYNKEKDNINISLSAQLGKDDILIFADNLPQEFQRTFPATPLAVQIDATGNLDVLNIHKIEANLPGAFTLAGEGIARNLTDSLQREANAQLRMQTGNLQFLTNLANLPPDSSIIIPPNIHLDAKLEMRGSQYGANLLTTEGDGRIHLDAAFNQKSEIYSAIIKIDSLQINHFMPKDSIGKLTVSANIDGRGIDFKSPYSSAEATVTLDELEYASYRISNTNLSANLRNSLLSAHLNSENELLNANAEATYHMNSPYIEATADVEIIDVNLYQLGITTEPLPHPVSLTMQALAIRDSVGVRLQSGDLNASLRSRSSLNSLIQKSKTFADLLVRQIDERLLDHAELRRNLPSASLTINSGQNNAVAHLLQAKNIKYNNVRVGFVATPRIGLNGRGAIQHLQIDTLQLDTVFFATHQDTTRLRLRTGIINNPDNPQITFRATATGEVRNEDAELMLNFFNDKGDTGLHLGVNVQPRDGGAFFRLIPEEPIVAFRRFNFNNHNYVFLERNLRLQADVEMLDSVGTGLIVHSMPDSINLQNIDAEIRNIELADFSRILPYFTEISGIFSLEANYRKSVENMQVSAEATLREFTYAETRIGNLGVGATWLPDGQMQYIDAYLTNEGEQILTANGNYNSGEDALAVNTTFQHFPLSLSNPFFPTEILELSGDIDGNLSVAGSTSAPDINGELSMHDVGINSYTYGIHLKPEERSFNIQNSRLVLDKYAFYSSASADNPFTINGYVDFKNFSAIYVDLSLLARNYPLLDARRSKTSELYGKAFIDLTSTIRGPISSLVMRGNLNLLDNTDATYVLRDSRLTVQDRLGDLVEFTSFSGDTIPQQEEEENTATTLRGIDVLLTINIEPSVKVGVDLSQDRSSYITLEGGGTLSFNYTPQGDMFLTGRYEFSGGVVKYALPVIPLKEFNIQSESYVEWTGILMDPTVNIKATERMRVSVPNLDGNGSSMKNFDVSILIKNKLEDLDLAFDLESPEDSAIQEELNAMDTEERGKQAVAMMVTGIYLQRGTNSSGGGFNMGSALNSLLQSQMASIAGSALKAVNISFGMDSYDDGSGSTRTDYNFRYSKQFFNDRVQVVIGGRVSTGGDEMTRNESFIDNISLEYRLDSSGTRYLRVFHNTSQNLLDGELTDTGVGIVLRKKVSKLGELFIFRKKKDQNE